MNLGTIKLNTGKKSFSFKPENSFPLPPQSKGAVKRELIVSGDINKLVMDSDVIANEIATGNEFDIAFNGASGVLKVTRTGPNVLQVFTGKMPDGFPVFGYRISEDGGVTWPEFTASSQDLELPISFYWPSQFYLKNSPEGQLCNYSSLQEGFFNSRLLSSSHSPKFQFMVSPENANLPTGNQLDIIFSESDGGRIISLEYSADTQQIIIRGPSNENYEYPVIGQPFPVPFGEPITIGLNNGGEYLSVQGVTGGQQAYSPVNPVVASGFVISDVLRVKHGSEPTLSVGYAWYSETFFDPDFTGFALGDSIGMVPAYDRANDLESKQPVLATPKLISDIALKTANQNGFANAIFDYWPKNTKLLKFPDQTWGGDIVNYTGTGAKSFFKVPNIPNSEQVFFQLASAGNTVYGYGEYEGVLELVVTDERTSIEALVLKLDFTTNQLTVSEKGGTQIGAPISIASPDSESFTFSFKKFGNFYSVRVNESVTFNGSPDFYTEDGTYSISDRATETSYKRLVVKYSWYPFNRIKWANSESGKEIGLVVGDLPDLYQASTGEDKPAIFTKKDIESFSSSVAILNTDGSALDAVRGESKGVATNLIASGNALDGVVSANYRTQEMSVGGDLIMELWGETEPNLYGVRYLDIASGVWSAWAVSDSAGGGASYSTCFVNVNSYIPMRDYHFPKGSITVFSNRSGNAHLKFNSGSVGDLDAVGVFKIIKTIDTRLNIRGLMIDGVSEFVAYEKGVFTFHRVSSNEWVSSFSGFDRTHKLTPFLAGYESISIYNTDLGSVRGSTISISPMPETPILLTALVRINNTRHICKKKDDGLWYEWDLATRTATDTLIDEPTLQKISNNEIAFSSSGNIFIDRSGSFPRFATLSYTLSSAAYLQDNLMTDLGILALIEHKSGSWYGMVSGYKINKYSNDFSVIEETIDLSNDIEGGLIGQAQFLLQENQIFLTPTSVKKHLFSVNLHTHKVTDHGPKSDIWDINMIMDDTYENLIIQKGNGLIANVALDYFTRYDSRDDLLTASNHTGYITLEDASEVVIDHASVGTTYYGSGGEHLSHSDGFKIKPKDGDGLVFHNGKWVIDGKSATPKAIKREVYRAFGVDKVWDITGRSGSAIANSKNTQNQNIRTEYQFFLLPDVRFDQGVRNSDIFIGGEGINSLKLESGTANIRLGLSSISTQNSSGKIKFRRGEINHFVIESFIGRSEVVFTLNGESITQPFSSGVHTADYSTMFGNGVAPLLFRSSVDGVPYREFLFEGDGDDNIDPTIKYKMRVDNEFYSRADFSALEITLSIDDDGLYSYDHAFHPDMNNNWVSRWVASEVHSNLGAPSFSTQTPLEGSSFYVSNRTYPYENFNEFNFCVVKFVGVSTDDGYKVGNAITNRKIVDDTDPNAIAVHELIATTERGVNDNQVKISLYKHDYATGVTTPENIGAVYMIS